MFPSPDGSLLVTGRFDFGSDGIAHFTPEGVIDRLVLIDGPTPTPSPAQRVQAATNSDGNIYVFYPGPGTCQGSSWSVPVGILRLAAQKWVWGSIRREIDCADADPYPDFVVDLRGRVWMHDDAGPGDEVVVYEAEETASGITFQAVRRYTQGNSHYNEGAIRATRDGNIIAFASYRKGAVFIDATVDPLPKPAPEWVPFLWDRAYLIWIPYVLLALILSVLAIRHNLKRP
jgi:hypothetical protein